MQQVRVIEDRDGNVLTSEETVRARWKEHFEELINKENERDRRMEGGTPINQEVSGVSKADVRAALKRMKNGRTVGL